MNPTLCPHCRKPTITLWVTNEDLRDGQCNACSKGRPGGAQILFLPKLEGDGNWTDGEGSNFDSLVEYLDGCFTSEQATRHNSLFTQSIPVLEALVGKLAKFGTPDLAPWITLVGKAEYVPINARNHAVDEAQTKLTRLKAQELGVFNGVKMTLVNWTLLKPDGNGMIDAVGELQRRLTNVKERLDWNRIKVISRANPDAGFIGRGSFADYCAFVFLGYSVAFLESPIVGNALYVMSSDQWQELSQLSKSSLLRDRAEDIERILHADSGWTRKLKKWYPHIFG